MADGWASGRGAGGGGGQKELSSLVSLLTIVKKKKKVLSYHAIKSNTTFESTKRHQEFFYSKRSMSFDTHHLAFCLFLFETEQSLIPRQLNRTKCTQQNGSAWLGS